MKNFGNRAFTLVGRTGVALFALILFIHGSTKNSTNVNNDAELETLSDLMAVGDEFELSERLLATDEGVASAADFEEITIECVPDDTATNDDSDVTVTAAEIAQGWRVVSIATNDVVSYEMPPNAIVYSPWAVRGGFQDRFWLDFADWMFPLGSNEYSRVAVSTWGEIWSEWNNEEKRIAAVGGPMAAVPGVSTFWWAEGENDSRILTWKDFALSRDTNTLVSAQMVLEANGDFLLYSNNVVRTCTRVETFDWDGDGIANVDDANPMRWDGNYLGQTEEQKEFVTLSVGSGLENGYYRFRATFPSAPTRRTLLTVGTNHVVVTDAGDYDFLLEKGIEYTFGTEPVNTNVIYTAVDDMPRQVASNSALMLASSWDTAHWVVGGGRLCLVPPILAELGLVVWLPNLVGAPSVSHIWTGNNTINLEAILSDCNYPNCAAFQWECSNGSASFSSPNSRTTTATFENLPLWDALTLSVSATIGTNVLYSYITTTCGQTNSEPYFACEITPTSGVILFEDAYENSPGQMVGRSSTFRTVSISGTTGTNAANIEVQLVSGGERVKVHEGSYDGPIATFPWSISVDKYKPIKKTFCVEALAASSSEDDICFKLIANDGDQEIVHAAKLTAVEIITEAVETWPTNRSRHIFGPKEEVRLRQEPQTPIVSFEARLNNHGKIFSSTNGTTLTIPDQPCTFNVRAKVDGGSFAIPFSCIAPSCLRAEEPRRVRLDEFEMFEIQPFVENEAAVMMHVDTFLEPQTVSFSKLRLFEGYAPPINRSGWYQDVNLFPDGQIEHSAQAGASSDSSMQYSTIAYENHTANGDYIGGWMGERESYSNGSYQVSIPLYWYTENATITNSLPDNLQTIQVFENGTMRVTKFGLTWERSLDNTEHEVRSTNE